MGFAECKDYRWGLADESHVGVAHFPCSCLNFPLRKKKKNATTKKQTRTSGNLLTSKARHIVIQKILEARIFWACSGFCASTALP